MKAGDYDDQGQIKKDEEKYLLIHNVEGKNTHAIYGLQASRSSKVVVKAFCVLGKDDVHVIYSVVSICIM